MKAFQPVRVLAVWVLLAASPLGSGATARNLHQLERAIRPFADGPVHARLMINYGRFAGLSAVADFPQKQLRTGRTMERVWVFWYRPNRPIALYVGGATGRFTLAATITRDGRVNWA